MHIRSREFETFEGIALPAGPAPCGPAAGGVPGYGGGADGAAQALRWDPAGEDPAAAVRRCARLGLPVFVFADRPQVAEALAQALCLLAPGLRIAGVRGGYMGDADSPAILAAVRQSGARAVVVSLAAPTEAIWIARYAGQTGGIALIGAGEALGAAARLAFLPALHAERLIAPRARTPLTGRRLSERLAAEAALRRRSYLRALRKLCTQRSLDVAVSAVALAALLPVMAAIAVAIRLDSPGPAIFRQRRIGQGGRPFTLFKFRSMCRDADVMARTLHLISDREGPCFKARRDPRITRVGRFLRRTSLDELPQLFNVLLGSMAIVGPRPALASEVAAYPAEALGRLAVKPGITGNWQVSGRAEVGFDRMIEMDLDYSRRRSVMTDLVLIARTFRAVLSGHGAY